MTPFGQYEFNRVPFGLCVSPSVFQRFINTIFRELIAEGIMLVYVDDLIVPAADELEMIERLRRVFHVAQKYGLQFNWGKCQFLRKKIDFLGYEIEDNRVRPSMGKTEVVQTYPEPRNIRQVQSFLGLAGYFRKYIQDFARIAKPISDLLRKNSTFSFDEQQRCAFEILKQKICERPVLAIFRFGAKTELHTDASKTGLAAILMQKNSEDGSMHPVQFFSAKTSDTEQRYHCYELEVRAVIKARIFTGKSVQNYY